MADLKTNYVDDVLDTTKNQLRKYQQIQNDDGTVSFVDVTEYTQVGTSFGAKDINDTNAAINDVNRNLSVRYNTDTDTVQILYNGTWVDWKSGEQTDIPLFISGQGSVNTDISGGFTKTSGNYTGNVNLNAIVMSTTNATNTSGLYSVVIGSGKLIDHTVYKKVKFHATVSGSGSNNAYANLNTAKTNYGDRLAPKDGYQRIVTGDNVLDISDAASNGYLCFFLGVNSGTVSVTIDSIVLCK
jgi:hypothetical protein